MSHVGGLVDDGAVGVLLVERRYELGHRACELGFILEVERVLRLRRREHFGEMLHSPLALVES
jgi:hypothetical protein